MKKLLFVLFLFIAIGAVVYFYFFKLTSSAKLNSINAVPENAVFIIDIEDPFAQWNTITQGKIWQFLKTNKNLSEIGTSIDSLNASFQQNALLWNMIASRPVSVSVHKIRKDKFDYLYIVDMKEVSKFSFFKEHIDKMVGDDTKVSKRTYHQAEIVELTFQDSHDLLYLYLKDNLLVLSATHVLIEQSIDQGDEPVIARDLDYIEVSKYIDDEGINIYLQHSYFKDYLGQWLNDEDTEVYDFVESLVYTGINLSMDDNYFSLSGNSTLNDSLNSYANIMHKSGKGEMNMHKIVPDNSLSFMSLGFDSFDYFYRNLEKSIEDSGDGDEYFKSKRKLEKFLDISIEDNFLSWMDDEAGVIQTSGKDKSNGYAAVLKVSNIENAKENLDFIKNQIKKKTPVKFKGVQYKGYEINFLSINGLFKVLLGKMFSKLEKPYYSLIDDYVVFSNHPGTLAKIITYYIEGKTLDKNEQYRVYRTQFDKHSSLFLYVNSKQMVPDSKSFLTADYWKVMNENKAYIERFPIIGLQVTPNGEMLATTIVLNYMPKDAVIDWNKLFEPLAFNTNDSIMYNQPQMEELITIDDIFPDDLNDKKMTENYENGQVRFEVALKDGLKEGNYRAYDSLGNVIIKGRYSNDQKTGVWKYYTNEGKLIKKEKN